MSADIFLDSSILVYAHDRQAGDKHARAVTLVESFWEQRLLPCISIQVLQELHVNLVRKGIDVSASSDIARRYLSWRVVENTKRLFRQALKIQGRWQTSFWDASIIAAAQQSGVSELWTEDLNTGQDFDGVRIVNPLRN